MKRSKFSLSHYHLLSGNMGYLIPLTWYEALPGDTIQQATSLLIRVSPLLAPVMHPVRVRIHHWFVPNRLIWDNWEKFITGGEDGDFTTTPPRFQVDSVSPSTLLDYLGVPGETYSPVLPFSALPVRAYNLIYNEHYRDQDLITEKVVSKADGIDSTTPTDLLRVSWEKDYFTTCRPWPQKGTEVTIPLGEEAPVTRPSNATGWSAFQAGSDVGSTGTVQTSSGILGDGTGGISLDPNNQLVADLSQATGISVNDLRLSLAIQRYQEARAQYGSRYVEYLRYLGVRSSDARLQNPEYLGGGRAVIQFSEVLQTGPEEEGDPVGTMKGHGISAMRTRRFRRFFEEHGIVMSLMSVVPKAMYMDGLHKKFHRETKEDYFQKELQFIGDQAVENKEIYASHSLRTETFGYQQRYDEYRQNPSSIHGEFRNTELNYWHYGRDFQSDVALNQSFIDAVPTDRVYAATDKDQMYIMSNHSIQARRMLAKYPTPKTF
ncbi:major capsid protein [Microviridae sp.]|nr:major capsid protein [Microviridae sp.]